MNLSRRIPCRLLVLSTLLVSGAALAVEPSSASRPATQPAGKIAATVNGEPIYESELTAGLWDDAFATTAEDMKKAKLKRLISEAIELQFLAEKKIVVSEDDVTKGIDDFTRMVKTPGCSCCGGGYKSLEQFMKINAFTMAEVRRRVACDIGMSRYSEQLTKEQTAPQALAEAARTHRAQIEADYVQGYVISFDYNRDPEYFHNEKAVEARKEKLANDALARLKKGEPFETVARAVSDHASAPKGGTLGCVRTDVLGLEVEPVLRKIEPDTLSGVIKTTWGCYIVMRKKLTDEQVLAVVKDQAKTFAEDQMYQEFKAACEQAKVQTDPAPVSAPVPGAPASR